MAKMTEGAIEMRDLFLSCAKQSGHIEEVAALMNTPEGLDQLNGLSQCLDIFVEMMASDDVHATAARYKAAFS